MKDTINLIRKKYENVLEEMGSGEENIKYNVVLNVALKELGYDVSNPIFEQNVNTGRVDIVLKINNNKLVIETKSGDKELNYDDISQLIRYLNSMGREWGILTNGRRYILLNANIEKSPSEENDAYNQCIVLDFDIYSRKDKAYFKYYNKSNLFDTGVTGFYKDIAQYKVYSKCTESSWNQKKSLLFSFFDYYASTGKEYSIKRLEYITPEDFEDFIEYKNNNNVTKRKTTADKTLEAQYTHLSTMLITLMQNGRITSSHFSQTKRSEAVKTNGIAKKPQDNYLNKENVEKVVTFLLNDENGYRNFVAFSLCAICGFEKSGINKLLWSDIKLEKGIILHQTRAIIIPKLILECLKSMKADLKIDRRKKKVEEYVFINKYGQPFNNAKSKGTLNNVFKKLRRIDDDEVWKWFTPESVRMWSIQKYWDYGYSVDEILYYTNMDFNKISKLLNIEDVYKRVEDRKNKEKRIEIFDGIFETSIEQWLEK